jgi:hypothetical protein
MSEPISIALIGSTGLTGSAALSSLLSSRKHPFSIQTITRKPPVASSTGHERTTHTNRTFPDLFSAVGEQLASPGSIYISCLGTTREQAGGFEQQKKIDWELNRDLAKKAKEDGASTVSLTFLIISLYGYISADKYRLYWYRLAEQIPDHSSDTHR